MEHLYDKNGIVFWSESEINAREEMTRRICETLRNNLISQNAAFRFFRVEAPQITPKSLINKNYSNEDVYFLDDDSCLRPETTMGSYVYAHYLLTTQKRIKMPLVVWQHGKSFRQEQDQVTKNMRLKEFHQLEFQIIFAESTANNYSVKLIPDLQSIISLYIGSCRVEPSDRLPDYAEWTQDIVREKNNMEVCSISLRKDFYPELNAKVLEVAIGSDRLVYNHFMNIN